MTPLFRTASGALYAQDAAGRVYRDGELMFSGPLMAIDTPHSPDGRIAVGERAFLLIDDGARVGWRITTEIVELLSAPVVPQPASDWRWLWDQLLPGLVRRQ